MLRALVLSLASLTVAGVVSIAGTGVAVAADDDMIIQDIWKAYTTARVAGDAEAWLALWDKDGIKMGPGVPEVPMETLVVAIPKKFAASKVDAMNITSKEFVVAGDWAYSRGVYTVDIGDVHVDGKYLTILKRQDDGSWKIYRDIDNSNSQ